MTNFLSEKTHDYVAIKLRKKEKTVPLKYLQMHTFQPKEP